MLEKFVSQKIRLTPAQQKLEIYVLTVFVLLANTFQVLQAGHLKGAGI